MALAGLFLRNGKGAGFLGKYEILEQYYGYTSFREGQEPMIDALLGGSDALGIMPTGLGKSLCYQIPALLLSGVTLVISPLISLMKDQVTALTQMGIPAAFLNSSLTAAQCDKMLRNTEINEYKIIYVAPERLLTDSFLSVARRLTISLVAVDEAHCVSQWGQDFRPGYLKIKQFFEELPQRPTVGAFTATATPAVRQDIVGLLELREPAVVTTSFDRKNLYLEVRRPQEKEKLAELLAFLGENSGKSGIIYCSTRKAVELVCERLCGEGYSAACYHAGLPAQTRKQNQEDFQSDRKTIMVATNAFGMGIDKSNVSFVVHYNMPKDIESYYQEIGRAGRDGMPAKCLLLYSGKDVVTNQFLIQHSEGGGEELDGEAKREIMVKSLERLKKMTFYSNTSECLRQTILAYFGEKAENNCSACYNCDHNFEEEDITVNAQKILSCISRAGERYGVKIIVDILRGAENPRLAETGLNRLSTFGIMRGEPEKRIRSMIDFLVMNDYAASTGGEYPVLKLAPNAGALLRGEKAIAMRIIKEEKAAAKTRQGRQKAQAEQNSALFSRLRALRFTLAKEQGVPAFVIFTDATLNDMCAQLPRTLQELRQVSGIGEAKAQRYGQAFLGEIAQYCEKSGS